MTVRYVMQAKENLSADLIAVVDAEIEAGDLTSTVAVTQNYAGVSIDRIRRKIVYSVCYVADAAGPWTNDTGTALWSGLHAIADGASYQGDQAKNFSVLTRSIDADTVTRYDCWSPTSLVPNGIGGSDGTYRRFVESDRGFAQLPKLIDPRTGNVWSHHVVFTGIEPVRSCLIYEFRLEDDYKQTISPYVPGADNHLELMGVTEDWVYVWDTSGTLELLPRLRTADELAADFLLSYASFAVPSILAQNSWRIAIASDGTMYWLTSPAFGDVPRNIELYKFEQPTSAPFGGPVVGGGFTDVTPWTSTTGPNTNNSGYRGRNGSLSNTNIVYYLPESDTLICLTKLIPRQKYPTPTNDPLDFSIDCTYVSLGDMAFDYHSAFVAGYMTSDWTKTTDPNAAAWAVLDCAEHDGDLSYHDYTFPDVDYTRRWFSFMVLPVVNGVIDGTYNSNDPFGSASHRVLVQYHFVDGSVPEAVRVLDETLWDERYPAYASAIGDPNVINASMALGSTGFNSYYDMGLWDGQTGTWWYSGSNTNVWSLNGAYTDRSPYVDNATVFLRLSLTAGKGSCRIRYGDIWG